MSHHAPRRRDQRVEAVAPLGLDPDSSRSGATQVPLTGQSVGKASWSLILIHERNLLPCTRRPFCAEPDHVVRSSVEARLGSIRPSPEVSSPGSLRDADHCARPLVVGQDPFGVERIWQDLVALTYMRRIVR